MNETLRFLTTAVIWLAYAGTVIAAIITGSRLEDWVIGLVIVIFGVLAAYATRSIWRVAQPPETVLARQGSKAKRDASDRIGRLIEALDEDEIIELETLLAVRQDEQR